MILRFQPRHTDRQLTAGPYAAAEVAVLRGMRAAAGGARLAVGFCYTLVEASEELRGWS
jgi:hypothetical protein